MAQRLDKDSLPLDKPRRTPDHPTKSHVVKTRVDGKEKIIRFGEQGAKTAGKPKEGESEAMKQKRASFKARHAKNIAKGKSSPAYWADKVKWATGGSVDLEDLDEQYAGIKKPDFKLLESFRQLISDLQARAEESGTQEFDPLRALGRSGAAESLEDLYASYADRPKESHARRAEAGAVDPDRASTARMVFDSFKAAGFSDAQAKALTAEINREGSLNPAYLFGTHTDAANKATNVGMLSWQGDRANRLMSFMADRGLIDPSGRITPGQDALNAQAEYLRWEMENDPSYTRTRETFLANPEIDPETAHEILGKNFIRWRIDDPAYRGSGFDRIYEGYDLLNMAQGYAEGGLAELAHKYDKGGKKKTQLSGSLNYKSGSRDDSRRKRASGSLTLSGDLGSITPGFSYSKDSSHQQFPDGFVVDEFGRQIGLSINGELFLDDSGENKLRAGASKDTMTGGYSETSGEELLGKDAYKKALERYFLGLDIGPLSLDVNKAGDDVSGRAAYRAGDNMEFSVEDSNRGDPTFGFQFAQRFAEGGLAELAHKYDKGGKKKDDEDELARAVRLRDLELMAEPKNPSAVPAEEPRLLNVGGLEERLAFLNQTLNPVEAIGDAMSAGRDLMASDAGGYDRLEALGRMLSGVAGVAGPAAVAKRIGAPAATALMEGLLGGSPTQEAFGDTMRAVGRDVVDRLNQPGPMPTTYSNPIPGVGFPPSRAPFDMGRGIGDNGGPAMESSAISSVNLPPGSDPRYVGAAPDRSGGSFARYTPKKVPERMRRLIAATEDPANPINAMFDNYIERGVRLKGSDWYNTEEMRDWFTGTLGEKEGDKRWREFIDLIGATSTGSAVPDNLRNASFYNALSPEDRLRVAEVVRGGGITPAAAARKLGINVPNMPPEKGPGSYNYGHVMQGNHAANVLNQLEGQWVRITPEGLKGAELTKWLQANPKVKGFANSLLGDTKNIAADKHFMRMLAMADGSPDFLSEQAGGSVEMLDTLRKAYGEAIEPYILTRDVKGKPTVQVNLAKAAKDGVITDASPLQSMPTAWSDTPSATEYAALEEMAQRLAAKYDMTPAQFQANLWMGAGDITGLADESQGTAMELFRRTLDKRAKERGLTREEMLKDFILNRAPLAIPIGMGAMSMQSAPAEANSIEDLDQKYAEGGKVNADDELERAILLRDLELMAQERSPDAVPAQDPSLLNVGGVGDRLALINKYLNPVEAIGESMRAGSRMMSPGVSGYDRVAALGDMLSGVAGVAGPAAVAKRVGAPAANAVADMARKYALDEAGSLPGMGSGQPERFGENWDDVYHWSRSPEGFSEFDPDKSKSAMSQLGPHVGTQGAAEARYMGFANPDETPAALGFTMPLKADLSKPFLNPATGKPWTEMDLEMFISAVSDVNNIDRKLVAPFMRERLAKEGYTSIPYMNDVEDAGSVSHIMLTERPASSDAVLRSRFAKFDPAMRNAKNLSAGVAAGAIGASQYDPDAIETTAARVRENKFAAGGAVKYDPGAVDRIITKLREVNRG